MMDYKAIGEWLKKNLVIVVSCILIIGLLMLARFYLLPLYKSEVTIENALYAKWAGISALLLLLLIVPRHFKLTVSFIFICGILNATALAFNDGYMPVASSSCIYVEENRSPFFETARLPFLCDWIFGRASIGDIFYYLSVPIYFGTIWFCRSKIFKRG